MPETTNMENLKRKRGALKAKMTTFTKFLHEMEELLAQDQQEERNKVSKVTELQIRVEKVEPMLQEFEDIQSQIEEAAEDFENELKEREQFESEYYKKLAVARQLLSDMQYEGQTSDDSVSVKSEVSGGLSHQKFNIKLPQINLPIFNGMYESWLEFRDTFQSLIHLNDRIGQIEKFHYLRSAVQGGAAQVVNSIEFSAANYPIAWELLCERFNNTALLIRTHMKSLFEIPVLTKESANELKTLVDHIAKNLRALNILKQPTEHWDTIIIYMITTKLDKVTGREWEEYKKRLNELPSLEDLKAFLRNRADLLETLDMSKNETSSHKGKMQVGKTKAFITSITKCIVCKGEHYLLNCEKYINLTTKERYETARKLRLCINCLRQGHMARDCRIGGKCKRCGGQHHTTLHEERKPREESERKEVVLTSQIQEESKQVILATALVQVEDAKGNWQTCRALLDSGAQSNFIVTSLVTKLKLEITPVEIAVVGITRAVSKIKEKCKIKIRSRHNVFEASISCLILEKISEDTPNQTIKTELFEIPNYIKLADPSYYKQGKIDILIGAGLFWQLLCIGQHPLGKGLPIIQKTLLGWVITGSFNTQNKATRSLCQFSKEADVQEQLEHFWKIEEWAKKTWSEEDEECERIFNNTTRRNNEGRFIVTIPLKESSVMLGDSKENAIRRLHALERKFKRNPEFKKRYTDFLKEYERLGHMTLIDENKEKQVNYLPHHGVINEGSMTTKLRVVFDGSSPTESGISFNDIQFAGPSLQEDVIDVLLRFRQYLYAICADICKMYRQMLVTPEQRELQAILWRENEDEEMKTYLLNTVTYGTKSAPYLALRCLRQLGIISQGKHPEAAQIILKEMYIDDLLSGANSEEELIKRINEVIHILGTAQLQLRKWVANNEKILQQIDADVSAQNTIILGKGVKTKTLGINWDSTKDVLMFNISEAKNTKAVTKRIILSEIAQIFDPMGLLSPCILEAKKLLQKLWLYKLSWDENVPQEVYVKWTKFRQQLPDISKLEIPRHAVIPKATKIQLHGFADASQEAYGAVIYIRSVNAQEKVKVVLLIAKGKVAPLKTQSIPRLELCGTLVLSQLMTKVKSALSINIESIHLWTDSTVALHWIHSQSSQLHPFVANRVSQIQTLTSEDCWKHVSTSQNPADLLTRGLTPRQLSNNEFWWQGPGWLSENEEDWPQTKLEFKNEPPETRKAVKIFVTQENHTSFIFQRYSTYRRLQRITAYLIRFIENCQCGKTERRLEELTAEELRKATNRLVKVSQQEEFAEEMKKLKKEKEVHKNSSLFRLRPFLDSEGVIRVGGRLQQSEFTVDKKHPMILAKNHRLTFLILKNEHNQLLHAGAQATLASVREQFWPIGGRNACRKLINSCIVCFKAKPEVRYPVMGRLPKERIISAPPFYNTGVDYAGPFWLKNKDGRGSKLTKAYICLFICMSTKAVHLELASSLSKDAFLACFRRFTFRRGKPSQMFSDNGKNFVAADKDLKSLLKEMNGTLKTTLATEGIQWNFIPVHAPHFGGLWEAGVKGVKHHLKRIIGTLKLTYEQFITVLIQIEGILNSRPLVPLSSDPSDLQALTPSHFLIGRTLTAHPEPDIRDVKQNRLSKFQLIQQVQQHFWARWRKEYLSELQIQVKWCSNNYQLEEGALVILKDDNLPALHWHLGRVVKVIPGPDGIARVAEVKTHNGIVRRAFSKLCPLPASDDDLEKRDK